GAWSSRTTTWATRARRRRMASPEGPTAGPRPGSRIPRATSSRSRSCRRGWPSPASAGWPVSPVARVVAERDVPDAAVERADEADRPCPRHALLAEQVDLPHRAGRHDPTTGPHVLQEEVRAAPPPRRKPP